jgi:lipopolysaccharide/colanic/teichoic acid biosynthesis glycosyltransferase
MSLLAVNRCALKVQSRPVWAATTKRAIDIIGAALGLVLLSPLLLVLAGLLMFDSGPIFYRRRVVGPRGAFDAFKFRSMRPDADSILQRDAEMRKAFESNFKLKSDPRVTTLGQWLRKYSLDELPQLFNVLLGQMSLVGPRMITAPELEKYGEHKQLLLTVKPGLTGYWQVHGRQEVSYEDRVRMDVNYINHWALKVDIQLLLVTPLRVIRGKGAY